VSPADRLGGTVAACLAAVDRGAKLLRVHDVFAVRQALAIHRAIGGAHA
jgi:dihydropteroate synthase